MKHHFGDCLDRNDDYWTIVPNISRYSYELKAEIADKELVKVATVGKNDYSWRQLSDFPNLEELTLNNPSHEQVAFAGELKDLKRLRLSYHRPKSIEFIAGMSSLEEVVFEYVSGFSDLSPIRHLKNLKSLHFENLRKVSDFSGLSGIGSLRYLHIDGTLDWNQPVDNFDFLSDLESLEVFSLGFISSKSEYPSLLSLLNLKNLKKIKIGLSTLSSREYAFLEVAFPNVFCCAHGGGAWKPCTELGAEIVFLGKRAGLVKKASPKAQERCEAFENSYEKMKAEAALLLQSVRSPGSRNA